jgi:conjugative relaxase-like TrwC/TraI family protein
MLRITPLRSAAGAKSYYSKSDYYGQELTGNWGGKAAARLGLSGKVDKAAFDRLCDNQNPASAQQLTPRNDDDRIVGYDFTFDVPKGVSIAYAMNQDERILAAFRDSVRETMEELEADMQTRVRGRGRNHDRSTGNIMWAEYVHFTARPVEGVPDMHLHSHMVVFSPTFDEQEDRWKQGKFLAIKRDAPYFQAAFHARLAQRLENIGYATERRGKDWDLTAVAPSLAKKFSRRTDQIDELARQKGIVDPELKSELGAKTREKKSPELTLPELRDIWRKRMSDEERSSLNIPNPKEKQPVPVRQAASQSLDHALSHVFERKSVAPAREVLTEALRHGVGQVSVEAVKADFIAKPVIIRKVDGREMATTREVLSEESAMLSYARGGRGKAQPLNKHWQIKREWLNDGQKNAVRHVLESSDLVTVIKGGAGTGKTSLMQETVEAIQAGGHQVFTFAPSAEASRDVLRGEGFENATTVAELLVNESLQREATGQVLWIDEAGLLGSRTLKQVFDVAQRIGAKTVLSGDWRQHGSVERGAAMRLLEQEGGIVPAVVSKIQRQENASYRKAVAHLAAGRTEEGFDSLDQLGWIQEIHGDARNELIAREYANDVEQNKKVLVVSPTNFEADAITSAIRGELKDRKLLDRQDELVTRLIPCHFTEAQRADPAMYEPGMVIAFTQNAKEHKKGERIVIRDKLPSHLASQARRFQVYRQDVLPLAKGDKLRATFNGFTKDGKHRINNRSTYEFAGLTENGDIQLSNGWVLSGDFGFLSHGYTNTSFGSQGKTVDGRVILAESSYSLPAASREQFYVSVSRAKRGVLVLTDDKEALREAVLRSDERLSATELVKSAEEREKVVAHFVRRHMLQEREGAEPKQLRELVHER